VQLDSKDQQGFKETKEHLQQYKVHEDLKALKVLKVLQVMLKVLLGLTVMQAHKEQLVLQ
jgi:hypothetical protein